MKKFFPCTGLKGTLKGETRHAELCQSDVTFYLIHDTEPKLAVLDMRADNVLVILYLVFFKKYNFCCKNNPCACWRRERRNSSYNWSDESKSAKRIDES